MLDLYSKNVAFPLKEFEYSCTFPVYCGELLSVHGKVDKSNGNCLLWATNSLGSVVAKGTAFF